MRLQKTRSSPSAIASKQSYGTEVAFSSIVLELDMGTSRKRRTIDRFLLATDCLPVAVLMDCTVRIVEVMESSVPNPRDVVADDIRSLPLGDGIRSKYERIGGDGNAPPIVCVRLEGPDAHVQDVVSVLARDGCILRGKESRGRAIPVGASVPRTAPGSGGGEGWRPKWPKPPRPTKDIRVD